MRKYDSTKHLKKMINKPNVGIVLVGILVVTFCFSAVTAVIRAEHIEIPTAKNDHFEPRHSILPTIYIDADGRIYFQGCRVTDMEKLPGDIADAFEARQPEEQKVLLKIDANAKFGRVQDVLTAVKKANIDVSGLITLPHAGLIDFTEPVKHPMNGNLSETMISVD
jgi:biopolymer transport protein ExbD